MKGLKKVIALTALFAMLVQPTAAFADVVVKTPGVGDSIYTNSKYKWTNFDAVNGYYIYNDKNNQIAFDKFNPENSDGNIYHTSETESGIATLLNGKTSTLFTTTEQGIIIDRTSADETAGTLYNDKIWALSKDEWDNGAGSGAKYVYGVVGTNPDNVWNNSWWLRTPNAEDSTKAYYVWSNGVVNTQAVSGKTDIRAGVQIDSSKILFLTDAKGGKGAVGHGFDTESYGNDYKMTLKSASLSTPTISNFITGSNTVAGIVSALAPGTKSFTVDLNSGLSSTATFDYSGLTTGSKKYLSAILADEDGNYINYANVADASTNASGSASLDLSNISAGNYNLYFFGEEANGDYSTDYASELTAAQPVTTSSDGELLPKTYKDSGLTATVKDAQAIKFEAANYDTKVIIDSTGGKINAQSSGIGSLTVNGDTKVVGDLTASDLVYNSGTVKVNGNLTSDNLNASGWDNKLSAQGTMAIGIGNSAEGLYSIAIGNNASAMSDYSMALGYYAKVFKTNTNSSNDAIALGKNAKVFGRESIGIGGNVVVGKYNGDTPQPGGAIDQSVAIGESASVTNSNSTVIGYKASASGGSAVSVGMSASSMRDGAISIGLNSSGRALNAIAIGNRTRAGDWTGTGPGAIAIGGCADANNVTQANAPYSTALGYMSYTGSSATNALALGYYANATHANSVALGANSVTSETYEVSVGNSTNTRKITNVTDPTEDQDAATKKYVDDHSGGGSADYIKATKYNATGSAASAVADASSTGGATAVGYSSSAGTNYSTAVGYGATAGSGENTYATAIGTNSKAVGANSIAIGGGSNNASSAQAGNDRAIAIGPGAETSAGGAIAIGSLSKAKKSESLAIGESAVANGTNSVALGYNSTTDENNTVAVGNRTISGVTAKTPASGGTYAATTGQIYDLQSNFESDGTTAKVATKATKDGDGNTISSTYLKSAEASSTYATQSGLTAATLNSAALNADNKTLALKNSAGTALASADLSGLQTTQGTTNATNITALQNNFETDGTTAKVATKAAKDGDGNTISSTYAKAANTYTKTEVDTALGEKQGTLSSAQLLAANSGITATKVSGYDTHIADTDIHVTAEQKTTWSGYGTSITALQNNFETDGTTAKVATKATKDGDGNTISSTYAKVANTYTKTEVDNMLDNLTPTSLSTTGALSVGGVSTFTGLATFNGGADMNNTKIVNVAAGSSDGDAVNYGQFKQAVTSATYTSNVLTLKNAAGGTVLSATISGGGSGNAVEYSDAEKTTVTLAGSEGTKITNLKDGTLASGSKDAVTGGQLYTTNQNVAANTANITTLQTDMTTVKGDVLTLKSTVNDIITTDPGTGQKIIENVKITNMTEGNVASGSKDAVTGGQLYTQTKVNDGNYIRETNTLATNVERLDNAVGKVSAGDYIAINTTNNVAQNLEALDTAIKNVEAGEVDVVKGKKQSGDVAASVTEVEATAVGYNAQSKAVGATSVGYGNVVTGERSTAVGYKNQISGAASGAFGDPNVITGSGSYAVGNNNNISGDNSFAIGNNITITSNNAIVVGQGSTDGGENTISVGSATKKRRIVNVADPVNDGDVATKNYVDHAVAAGGGADVAAMAGELKEVGAKSAALAGLRYMEPSGEPGDKISGSIAYGGYRGESAGAVGLSYKASDNLMVNAATTFGTGEQQYNAGVSFRFGPGNTARRAELAKQVKYINEKNKKLEANNAALHAEVMGLKNNAAERDEKYNELKQENAELKNELKEMKKALGEVMKAIKK